VRLHTRDVEGFSLGGILWLVWLDSRAVGLNAGAPLLKGHDVNRGEIVFLAVGIVTLGIEPIFVIVHVPRILAALVHFVRGDQTADNKDAPTAKERQRGNQGEDYETGFHKV
jgi:hypothetical protein